MDRLNFCDEKLYYIGGVVRDELLKKDSFDIDIETSMKRVGKEKDRMESAGNEFFNRVRNGYLELAKHEPKRIKVVNSTGSIEEIHEQVIKIMKD